MDGTLTVPVHDFEAIREDLGLPRGRPILEALEALPAAEADPLHQRLKEIEGELARRGRSWPDVRAVLERLQAAGAQLGILTRNTHELALITLAASGLGDLFEPAFVLGREDAAPKPSPAGVDLLLSQWGAEAADCTMVGDYLFDLQAGRAAGCTTVLVDRDRHGRWQEWADRVVGSFEEL